MLFPSSMFPRVSLATPSWNRATYAAILRCLWHGQTVNGPDLERLRVVLSKELDASATVLCGSGSLALELALRSCAVGNGDEVIIPSFCCSAVVSPIVRCGATAVLADIGAELNLTAETVEAAVTHKTKAVVVPHLFGNPADIQAIISLVRPRGIAVIDDAAQALGATIDSQPVGSFGDAGILSFGTGKVCVGIGGGVLIARNSDAIVELIASLAPPAKLTVTAQLLSTLIWSCWRRWTVPAEALLRRRPAPHEAPAAYRPERMANLQAAVGETLLRSLGENIAARRTRVRLYRELLGGVASVKLIPHRPGSACLSQVLRIERAARSEDPAAHLIGILRSAGFEVQGSYLPIHQLAQLPHCVWDRLPNTDKVWPDLVELPCEPGISLDEVERIAAIVRQVAQAPRPN